MKVIVLCGGMGTRLREETEYRPKPMVEVGGRPILWHIMKYYSHFGFREFVLCLGYRGRVIKEYFLNYEAMNNDFSICLGRTNQIQFHNEHREQGFHVTLAETGLETMTGGRIKRAAKYLGDDDTFLMTYGDGLANVDLHSLLEFHKSHGKIATVTSVNPPVRYGILGMNADGGVNDFFEKPISRDWISAGFFVFNRKVLDYIADDQTVFENGPLEQLTAEGQLMAYRHKGFFYAMDTYREYVHLNEMWKAGDAPWKVW
jgi:glucose-1-phosphate cytidylyltransferase